MTKTKRIEILKAARTLADRGEADMARAMFALVGVDYVPAAQLAGN